MVELEAVDAVDSPKDRVAMRPDRPSGIRIFCIAFVVLFGASAIWSAATPMLAAPDEPSQIVKAAAVAHGRWTAVCFDSGADACPGDRATATTSATGLEALPSFWSMVRAPDSADPPHSQICFHARSTVPASCARSLNRSPSATDRLLGFNKYVWTYQARYPPLYYAVVGLPSHFGGSTIDIYLMRLISAALSAIFLAIALSASVVSSTNRLLTLGVVAATTPMVLFLAGVVNPSGLEISSGVATWTTGAIIVTEHLPRPPRGLVALFVLSAAVLEATRPLSPFWLALIVLFLIGIARPVELRRALSSGALRVGGAVVALVGGASVAWILTEHATDLSVNPHSAVPRSVSTATILATSFRHNVFYLPDMIGIFGWFDARSPEFTYVAWYGLVIALVLAAIVRVPRRAAFFVVFVVAILVVPVLISSSHVHTYGYTWSGRDALPFAVGLPILAAVTLGGSRGRTLARSTERRALRLTVALAGIAQVLAFGAALRRYAVGGAGGVFSFVLHPRWQPAITIDGALGLEVAAIVGLSALYLWCGHGAPIRRGSSGRDREIPPVPGSAGSVPPEIGVEGA